MKTLYNHNAGSQSSIEGPSWDLSSEYAGFDSPAFSGDLSKFEQIIASLASLGTAISNYVPEAASLDPLKHKELLDQCKEFAELYESAMVLRINMGTYANCVLSTDGGNADAKRIRGMLVEKTAVLNSSAAGMFLIMKLCPDSFFDAFCNLPNMHRFRFTLSQDRKLRNRTLPLDVEKTLNTMSPSGYTAWGDLYDNLTGTLTVTVKKPDGTTQEMGLASAATLLKQPDRALREAAWRGINAAMQTHEESFAAILNSLAGWRHAEAELRSYKEKVHFLDTSLFQSRITRNTLDTLISVLKENRELGRKALKLQAKLYKVDRLGPWDILAPAPELGKQAEPIPYSKGLEMVQRAYASIGPAMGNFVAMMAEQKRIEGRVKDGKRPGAYCTEFAKTRKP
ncbi:MAG TPA: M3 family metallopeptidase, partial [Spirochaetales bacterium]|nr:M3 family metallopeptidase [Spirochaetales bacterium]